LDSKSDKEGFLKVSRLTDRSGVFDFAGAGDEFLVFRFTQFFEIQPLTFITGIDKIDKNSLFGGLKIPKGELCVKEISPTISRVWVGGLFSGGGGIWGSRWGAAFSAIGGGFSGDFEVQPGTPVPSALDSLHFLRTEGKHPKDSLGHDKGDRRSGEVERIDPGRIPLALIRSCGIGDVVET
jgi:hypothetical protein